MLLVHLNPDFHLILNTKAVTLLISFFLTFFIPGSLLPSVARGDGGESGFEEKEAA